MSDQPNGWSHKDLWKRFGDNFLVEVSRHAVERPEEWEGKHRWCVYAYIYPGHWHFPAFKGTDMWQEAASMMPLHGGPSYLRNHEADGKIMSIQVGADYNHLHDERYTHMATAEEAYCVFRDAEELFNWLSPEKKEQQS